jgi:ferredoxin
MAFSIQPGCTACGDCLPVCPNGAILALAPVYRIIPVLCTECVGYSSGAECVAACPEEAIVPAPEPVKQVLA